jgi:hypothetical protein
MYFEIKSTLKSNYYHTLKHTERNRLDVPKTEIGSTTKKNVGKHCGMSIPVLLLGLFQN